MLPPLALLIAATACRAPPDAPEDFEDLTAYLFARIGEGDDRATEAGIDNLATWLDTNFERTDDATQDGISGGYTVRRLTQASLDALEGGRERDATALIGGAVASASGASVDDLANAFLVVGQTTIYPDDYESYERIFRGDRDCFVALDCDELLMDNNAETRLPFGIKLTTRSTAQYRWIDAEVGRTLVTRSWLREPGKSQPNLLQLDDQFFLSANVPTSRGLVRVQAVWANAGIIGLSVPEGAALDLLVDGMRTQDETLYAWLDGN